MMNITSSMDPSQSNFSQLMDFQRAFLRSWPGESLAGGLLRGTNMNGSRTPLVWCFNGAHEFEMLGQLLGSEQPLIAARSFNGVLEGPYAKPELARRYGDEISEALLAIRQDSAFAVGGNCQASDIATQIALSLQSKYRAVPVLFQMERVPPVPFHGNVAMIFGADSLVHPFRLNHFPEIGWGRLFQSLDWEIIPGAHGEFFRPKNAPSLCAAIEKHLRRATAEAPTPLPINSGIRLELLSTPINANCAERFDLTVRVQAPPMFGLAPGEVSALVLDASWWREDKCFSAAQRFIPAIAAGEGQEISLVVPAPNKPGTWRLSVQLSELGIEPMPGANPPVVEAEVQVSGASTETMVTGDVLKLTGGDQDSTDPEPLIQGLSLARKGNLREASKFFEAAVPDAFDMFLYLGLALQGTEQAKWSDQYFRIAGMIGQDADSRIRLAQALISAGHPKESISAVSGLGSPSAKHIREVATDHVHANSPLRMLAKRLRRKLRNMGSRFLSFFRRGI